MDELAQELLAQDGGSASARKISVHVVDTGSVADIEQLFRDLKREHYGGAGEGAGGGPDILISNAGYGKRISEIVDIPLDEFDYTLNINLRASFLLSKHSVPWMQERGWGRIVFVSSIAAIGGGINGCHCKFRFVTSGPPANRPASLWKGRGLLPLPRVDRCTSKCTWRAWEREAGPRIAGHGDT